MKSKFTSILMFFIIIAIIAAFGLLGVIVWQEISDKILVAYVGPSDINDYFDTDDNSVNTIDDNIEVPNIINNPLLQVQEASTQEEKDVQINYDNVKVNKYFYNQLDNYSQTIYKAFEENKENMKTGTYKINFGKNFSDILSKENGQDELGKYYQAAIEAYTYDNPDVFYLSPSKMYLNIETTTRGTQKTYNAYIDCGSEANYLTDQFASKEEVDKAMEEIEKVRNIVISHKTGNTYNDIKMIHNFLVDNLEYDTSISEEHIYDIYGALVNNKCVCEGYAKALKYLLDSFGIESTLVIGKGTNSQGESENHAWNYIKLDGSWYAVDTTWDDPIVLGGILSSFSKYKYFLKGSNTFYTDHFPSGRFTNDGKEFIYPTLSTTDY